MVLGHLDGPESLPVAGLPVAGDARRPMPLPAVLNGFEGVEEHANAVLHAPSIRAAQRPLLLNCQSPLVVRREALDPSPHGVDQLLSSLVFVRAIDIAQPFPFVVPRLRVPRGVSFHPEFGWSSLHDVSDVQGLGDVRRRDVERIFVVQSMRVVRLQLDHFLCRYSIFVV